MKKKLFFITLLLFVLNHFAQTPTNNILYVKKGSTGNGSSWSNALGEVADALKYASQNAGNWTNSSPLQIWVSKGSYLPKYTPEDGGNFSASPSDTKDKAFLMVKNVKLYGGFVGTETTLTQRNFNSNITILSGDLNGNDAISGSGPTLTITNNTENAYHAVVCSGDIGIGELNGFTIKGGNANKISSSGTGNYIKINSNSIFKYSGGGINIQASGPIIAHNTFTGNAAYIGAASIISEATTTEFSNNKFTLNKATTYAGAIYNYSNIRIVNSFFYGNYSLIGGAICSDTSSLTLANDTFIGNYGSAYAGAVYNWDSAIEIANSIFFGNTASEGSDIYTFDADDGTFNTQYSLIQSSTTTSNGNIDPTGLAITDIFNNPTSGDYSLKAESLAVNGGNNSLYPGNISSDSDLAGNYRVFDYANGSVIDMGCYEYQGVGDIIWNGSSWSNNGTGPNQNLNVRLTGTFNSEGSFSAKNLRVTTGSLDIQPNQNIKIYGNITQSADNKIILESDAGLIQSDNNAINDTKKITVKRNTHMRKADYTYWSSPVTGQKLLNNTSLNDGFSVGTPNNRIYNYNEPNDYFVATTDQNFLAGKAYAIRGKDAFDPNNLTSATYHFIGSINNGSHTVTVQKSKNTTTVEHGYNLIGNPYPSNIDFEKFYNLGNNKNYINAKAWFWTNISPVLTQAGSGYNGNNYATLTLTGGAPPTGSNPGSSLTPTKYIKVGQGFIVQVKDEMTTTSPTVTHDLTFDNSIRTDGTGVFYNAKNNTQEKDRYWLQLISPQNYTNTILIGHIDGATNLYDKDYDAELISIGDDSVYTLLDSQKMQIEGRQSPLSISNVIPIGTKFSENGTYKFAIGSKEGIFDNGQSVYLHDKNLNKLINLSNENYVFQAKKGTDDNRFEIVYKENPYLETNDTKYQNILVYKDGDSFVIKAEKLTNVELFDTAGSLIAEKKLISGNEIKIDHKNLLNGVYVLKIQQNNNIISKKVIK